MPSVMQSSRSLRVVLAVMAMITGCWPLQDPEGVFFGQAGEGIGGDFDGREAGEDGKPEERAFAGFAFHRDAAVEQLHQPVGDSQAEAGAAELAGAGRVNLGK